MHSCHVNIPFVKLTAEIIFSHKINCKFLFHHKKRWKKNLRTKKILNIFFYGKK
jgi:hypothetical protein